MSLLEKLSNTHTPLESTPEHGLRSPVASPANESDLSISFAQGPDAFLTDTINSALGADQFARYEVGPILIDLATPNETSVGSLALLNEQRRQCFIESGFHTADYTNINPSLFLDEDFLKAIGLGNIAVIGIDGQPIESLSFQGQSAVQLTKLAKAENFNSVLGVFTLDQSQGSYAIVLEGAPEQIFLQTFSLCPLSRENINLQEQFRGGVAGAIKEARARLTKGTVITPTYSPMGGDLAQQA